MRKRVVTEKRRRQPLPLPPPQMTEEQLNALFDNLNQSRFGGTLLKARVSWNEPGGWIAASYHHLSALGPSIWISRFLTFAMTKRRIREILLHEMCHVKAAMESNGQEQGHGPLWQAAMMHLYQHGEKWVLNDLGKARRADAERELEMEMLSQMSQFDPTLPWRKVRHELVRNFGSPAADFLNWSSSPEQFWRYRQRNNKTKKRGGCG